MSISLYAHFPWCVKKCPYCDFNSHPLGETLDETAYVQALLRDYAGHIERFGHRPIGTIFFGGGTPSLFSASAFAELIESLSCTGEVTMEANPGTTEHAEFAAYRAAGINRLSLGAQSFNQDMLSRLGRIHSAANTLQAFEQARSGGFDNINLDLMYALPGQSVASALADLKQAIELEPEHLSWYQLTIEPRTAFHKNPPQLPEDDCISDIEREGRKMLADAGYERYEVSAWCRPGAQCAHNLNYWRFGDYVGIGAGAHGKVGATRTDKAKAPSRYLADPSETNERTLSKDDLRFEALLNVLRLVDGVSWETFTAATGLASLKDEPDWLKGCELGLLRSDRLAATPLGYNYLDSVLAMF